MPPKRSKDAETSSWLVKAFEDLESADILFKSDRASQWHQVLFHCQQAVEKSLKAFLVWHETEFRRTHNLREVGGQCCEIEPSLKPQVARIVYLSDYAWEFRYPGEDEDPTKKEARTAIINARTFIKVVIGKMPSEIVPKNLIKTYPKKKK